MVLLYTCIQHSLTHSHTHIDCMHIFALYQHGVQARRKHFLFFRPIMSKCAEKSDVLLLQFSNGISSSKTHGMPLVLPLSIFIVRERKRNVVIYWFVMLYKMLLTFQFATLLALRSTPSRDNL